MRFTNPRSFLGALALFLFGMQELIAAQPSWFLQPSQNSYEIIGYGQASTLDEARKMALRDISETLKVKISSSTNINKKMHNESFDSNVVQSLKTSSSAVLVGTKVKHRFESDGVWYVAVAYDSSPLGSKLKRALKRYTLENEVVNYLSATELIRGIDKNVGFNLRYNVIRESDLWMLRYKDTKIAITEDEFIKLFRFKKGNNIDLALNQKIFYPHDQMKFFIKSKDAGYVSMLYVEENGKVGVLFANKKSGKHTNYPPKNSDEELIVANPYKKILHEMYLSIWSKKPIDLIAFEDINSDYLDDSNYKFGELAKLLDNVDFSSVVVKVKF